MEEEIVCNRWKDLADCLLVLSKEIFFLSVVEIFLSFSSCTNISILKCRIRNPKFIDLFSRPLHKEKIRLKK
jgi:hypothetical protein